jgi:hypothetical protein
MLSLEAHLGVTAAPSLHPHYKDVSTTTGSSAPRYGIGILPHRVGHLSFPFLFGHCRHSGTDVGVAATGRSPDIRASIAANVRFRYTRMRTFGTKLTAGGLEQRRARLCRRSQSGISGSINFAN